MHFARRLLSTRSRLPLARASGLLRRGLAQAQAQAQAQAAALPPVPDTMTAVRVHRYGDASVLAVERVPVPVPKLGQSLVRVAYAGVNFIDVYERAGTYKSALPLGVGKEASGVVVRVGLTARNNPAGALVTTGGRNGARRSHVGDRVVWYDPAAATGTATGAYAEYALIDDAPPQSPSPSPSPSQGAAPASEAAAAHLEAEQLQQLYAMRTRVPRLVLVPQDVRLRDATAAYVQGLTAEYLMRLGTKQQPRATDAPRQTVLIHAAAGGTGRLLVQLALLQSMRVVALASSADKRQAVHEMARAFARRHARIIAAKAHTAGLGVTGHRMPSGFDAVAFAEKYVAEHVHVLAYDDREGLTKALGRDGPKLAPGHALVPGDESNASSGAWSKRTSGADIVFDSVGAATYQLSLDALKARGSFLSFGQSSGVPDIKTFDFMKAGSVSFTRPTLADFTSTFEHMEHASKRLFDRLSRGYLSPLIEKDYALADVAQAHRALESRSTMGKLLIAVAPQLDVVKPKATATAQVKPKPKPKSTEQTPSQPQPQPQPQKL